jgi:hypothetical protein
MKKIIILFILIFTIYSCSNEEENYDFESFENKSLEDILSINCGNYFIESEKYIDKCLALQDNKKDEIRRVLSIDVDEEYIIKNNYEKEYDDYLKSFNHITYDEYILEFNFLVDS